MRRAMASSTAFVEPGIAKISLPREMRKLDW